MPRPGPLAVALAAVAALAVATPAAALAASPSSPAAARALDLSVTKTLGANVLPGLARATDNGLADQTAQMKVIVTLTRPAAAAEKTLLAELYDPTSPMYRHFLTPAQIKAQFSVAPAVQSAAAAWLTGAGLTIDDTGVTGDMIQVHGPAAAVEKAFATPVDSFTQAALTDPVTPATTFLANTLPPTVPAALDVLNVVGLNTYQHFTRSDAQPANAKIDTKTAATPAQDTCVPGVGCLGSATPADLQSVYNQPSTYTGAGQSVGVFGEGDTAAVIAELRVFEAMNKFPVVPTTTLLPPGDKPPADDPAGDGEWQIDTQATTGMAPDVKNLRLYFGADPNLSDADVLAEFTQWVTDPQGPNQMDASFGECEQLPAGLSDTAAMIPTVTVPLPVTVPVVGGSVQAGQGLGNQLQVTGDAELELATMEGRTLFSSTGDTGSSCPVLFASVIGAGNGVANQGVPLTSYPASSPYVTGVGGTVLYTDGNTPAGRFDEYAWTFGGGGDTLFIDEPAYQQVEPGVNLPCVTDAGGTAVPGGKCRGIADVAAVSGDTATNGYQLYNTDGTTGNGAGTSLSSPLWAGMWARVSQGVNRNAAPGAATGFANMELYPTEQKTGAYARDFFDVGATGSTMSLPPTGNGAYLPMTGWDYTTGYGTPHIDGIICDVDGTPSGTYATGVAGVCPLTAAAAPAAPVVTTAPVAAPVATGTLASTGLDAGLPLAAVALVGGAVAVRRRRRA